jgi:hypothetical protein
MKTKLSFVWALILITGTLLMADTIIDSVYAIPELDGNMCYGPDGNFFNMNNTTYSMKVGDIGVTSIPVVPVNSTTRSFFSFELPEISYGYQIDSVFVRLYQFWAIGGLPAQNFPVWNVAGGDTIKCILNHIDYGFELDPDDWEKGNIGNPYTYTNNVGTVTEDGEDGYRYVDVTDCVLLDYQLQRILSQYRISFQIDNDWDDHSDNVSFATAESFAAQYWPILYFHLSNVVGIDKPTIPYSSLLITNLSSYPNPFNPVTTINYNLSQNSNVLLKVYNLKGQLIENLVNQTQAAGQHSVSWNAVNQSSGIYFYQLHTGAQTTTGKCLLIK